MPSETLRNLQYRGEQLFLLLLLLLLFLLQRTLPMLGRASDFPVIPLILDVNGCFAKNFKLIVSFEREKFQEGFASPVHLDRCTAYRFHGLAGRRAQGGRLSGVAFLETNVFREFRLYG